MSKKYFYKWLLRGFYLSQTNLFDRKLAVSNINTLLSFVIFHYYIIIYVNCVSFKKGFPNWILQSL